MRQKLFIGILSLSICGGFIGLHFAFEKDQGKNGGRTPSSYRSSDYTQGVLDRQYITLKNQPPTGNKKLIHQKGQDEDYLKRLFGLIIQKADSLARDDWYLPDVPSRNYFTFLLGSLTVPYHESHYVHLRQRSNDKREKTLCEQSANGVLGYQKLKNHFSRLDESFTKNLVDCSQLTRNDSPLQLVASGDHSDVGLMQINFKVHTDHFRSQKIFNLQETLSYGLDYYYKGFTRYAHSFNSVEELKKNHQRRSCLFPKQKRSDILNLESSNLESFRPHMSENLIDPTALLYSGWSGYYNSGPGGKACRFAESLQCLQAMKKEKKFSWFSFLKSKRDIFEKMAEDYEYLGEAPTYKREHCPWWENDIKLIKGLRDFTLRGSDHFHTYLPEDSVELKALNEILQNFKQGTHKTDYLNIVRETDYTPEKISYPAEAQDSQRPADNSSPVASNDSPSDQDGTPPHPQPPQEPNSNESEDDSPQGSQASQSQSADEQEETQERNSDSPRDSDQQAIAGAPHSGQDRADDNNNEVQANSQNADSHEQNTDDQQFSQSQKQKRYNYYIVVNRSNIRPAPTRDSTVCGNMKFADEYPLKVILYPDSLENHYYEINAKNVQGTIFRPNHPDCRGRNSYYVHMNLVKRIPKELDTFDIASNEDSFSNDDKNSEPDSSVQRSPAKPRRAKSTTWIWLRDAFGISRSEKVKMLNPEDVFQIVERKVLYDSNRNGYIWYKILHPEGEVYYVYSGEEGSADQYVELIN